MMKELEQYIRMLVEEETNATEDMPYGNHLFGDARKKEEKDTGEEKKLYKSLEAWVYDSSDGDINNFLEQVLDLLKQGKYEDVLRPESGTVYRGTSITVEKARSLFGKDIDRKTNSRGVLHDVGTIDYVPRAKKSASWTYDRNTAVRFAGADIRNSLSGKKVDNLGMLLTAKIPNSGHFIINYKEIPYMVEYSEEEVISIGNIECSVTLFKLEKKENDPFVTMLTDIEKEFGIEFGGEKNDK